ncbi:MAG: glycosyltransferase family 4 protein [Chloroflexota bacterium]|nr:glycosyltransferase family 4 protein [Dehalococcoidia bacterium]MDW8254255.1 glycosyltransferase family 4 protein [Chloroflexota bacterium]
MSGQREALERWTVLKIAPTSFFADYGCHVRILEESEALRRLGHRVTIVTYPSGDDPPALDVRRAFPLPILQSIKAGPSKRKPLFDLLLAVRTLHVALRLRPTVIHAHLHEGALIGALVARPLRIPLIFDFQGSLTSEMIDHGWLSRGSPWYRPLLRLERLITRLPDAIITSSQNAATILAEQFDVPPSRIATVPDSVDPHRFIPRWEHPDLQRIAALRARLGIPEGRPVVVYLGLLSEYQGTSKLLEAATLLTRRGVDAHYLVMGFPGEDTYSRIAAELGIASRVTFTGRIPYREAPDYLLIGDIAVSPKLSETEGNGKLLNYQAAGLPTVAFDTPVAREILGDLGVYARQGDPHSLADRLGELIADPVRREQLGRALRSHVVARQSWDTTVHLILKVYRTTAAR